MNKRLATALIFVLIVSAGCASSGSLRPSASSVPELLTARDLEATQVQDAYRAGPPAVATSPRDLRGQEGAER